MTLPFNSKFFIRCLLHINHYLLINPLAEFEALPVLVFGNCTVIHQEREKKISGDHLSAFFAYTKLSIRHWCSSLCQSTQNLSSLHAVISNMKEMATDVGENQGQFTKYNPGTYTVGVSIVRLPANFNSFKILIPDVTYIITYKKLHFACSHKGCGCWGT